MLHATSERSLGKLGGLIRRMPWVAWLALVGTLAIAGLPPLNGFVSEWLLLQAFLFTPRLPQLVLNMLVPVARGRARAGRGAGRLRDGQVLRRRLPRPAARGNARRMRTTPARWSASGLLWLARRLRRCSACCRCTSSCCSITVTRS